MHYIYSVLQCEVGLPDRGMILLASEMNNPRFTCRMKVHVFGTPVDMRLDIIWLFGC